MMLTKPPSSLWKFVPWCWVPETNLSVNHTKRKTSPHMYLDIRGRNIQSLMPHISAPVSWNTWGVWAESARWEEKQSWRISGETSDSGQWAQTQSVIHNITCQSFMCLYVFYVCLKCRHVFILDSFCAESKCTFAGVLSRTDWLYILGKMSEVRG